VPAAGESNIQYELSWNTLGDSVIHVADLQLRVTVSVFSGQLRWRRRCADIGCTEATVSYGQPAPKMNTVLARSPAKGRDLLISLIGPVTRNIS
jgi:hypothetical protein